MLYDFFKRNFLDYKITVRGKCMEPIIKDGDIVTIHPCKQYNIGDIVLCIDENNIMYIHRIYKITDGKYYTKADNNICADKMPVMINNIYGKFINK